MRPISRRAANPPGVSEEGGTWRPRVVGTTVIIALCLTAACSVPLDERPGAPQDRFEAAVETAVAAIEQEHMGEAAKELRALAADCRSGVWGREALLLWSLLELDPRHPEGSPHLAARLAAHYLQVPGTPPTSVPMSETIYLLALELGGEPVADPSGTPDVGFPVATRFRDCGAESESISIRALPAHPGPVTTWGALEATAVERDALAERVESLSRTNAALEEEVDALETELQRIRSLFFPDGVPPGHDSANGP